MYYGILIALSSATITGAIGDISGAFKLAEISKYKIWIMRLMLAYAWFLFLSSDLNFLKRFYGV